MTRICLNMIVKNESPVIERCLASVKPWIGHWVIVDTGSTDGTQELVRKAMAGVPGELHERPWRNFGHNRNEALDLARAHGDYVLFIDADEQLQVPPDFTWPQQLGQGCMFLCHLNDWTYWRNALVSTTLPWRWEGVLHEYLTTDTPHHWVNLPGPEIMVSRDGARARDPKTYLKDIEVLQQALQEHPGNTRYSFYLAQSMRDAGLWQASIDAYAARMQLGGWDEEVWYSALQIAVLKIQTPAPAHEVQQAFLQAFEMRPTRAEPLYELSFYLRRAGFPAQAYLYALRAAAMPKPDDLLFVDAAVYEWKALDELGSTAWHAKAMEDGRRACLQLLAENRFAPQHRERIEENLRVYTSNTG